VALKNQSEEVLLEKSASLKKEMGRRTRQNIIYEILQFCASGQRKTNIMYKLKLSYNLLTKYLGLLLEKGFLEEITEQVRVRRKAKPTKIYRTTEKGLLVLEACKICQQL